MGGVLNHTNSENMDLPFQIYDLQEHTISFTMLMVCFVCISR